MIQKITQLDMTTVSDIYSFELFCEVFYSTWKLYYVNYTFAINIFIYV